MFEILKKDSGWEEQARYFEILKEDSGWEEHAKLASSDLKNGDGVFWGSIRV